jgi:hypothetical protein
MANSVIADNTTRMQAEVSLLKRFQQNWIQAFFKSFLYENRYVIQSLPDTLKRLYASLHFPSTHKHRARFNTSVNPLAHAAFLNAYLPRRADVYQRGSLVQQQQYEDTLAQLRQQFLFFQVSYSPTQCTKVPCTDAASQYLFCGQVLELFYHRLDLVNQLLNERPHGFHVQFCTDFDQTYFDPGYIQINPVVLWLDGTGDRSPGVNHVCLHLLSQQHNNGVQADTLPGMTPADEQVIAATKHHLAVRAQATDFTPWGRLHLVLTGQPQTGVHPYAFYPPMAEFLTTTVENSMKCPQWVAKTPEGQALLQCYQRYFQWTQTD